MEKQMNNEGCQMTMSDDGKLNGIEQFWECGKPAKFTYWDDIRKKRRRLCGIHKHALEKKAKARNRDPKIEPI